LFCKFASGEISTEFVYSDDEIMAFRDINPQAPVHVLVAPRKHIVNYATASEEDELLLGRLARAAATVARREGVADSGFRTAVNNGSDAHQTVPHLHLHVLGGRELGWPPG
jgi:histidine triad (HIT) family protein